MAEKKSGHVGVAWHKGHQKWIAYITVSGKQKYLGVFNDLKDAIAAREKAAEEFPPCKKKSRKEITFEAQEKEKLHYLNSDMSKLSVDQRACLLDYLGGMSAQDIADKRGINKPVVYNRIREAKNIIDTGAPRSPEEVEKRRKYAQKYYQEHKDEMKARSRKYAAEHPESVKEANRRNYLKYREKRLEERREYNKKYYAKNREQILTRSKARSHGRMIDEKILKAFNKSGSVSGAAKEARCSWNRVIKSLSSSGVLINDTHKIILDLCDAGMTPEQIAKQVGISIKTVQAYLPRVRPVYGENRSKNAKKINEWRVKQKGGAKNE